MSALCISTWARLTNHSGTCPHDPPIRVLAMPAPTMLFAIGVELIIVDILRIMKVPAPCRISSLPQGAPLRPGIYAYIEDICAVDGSGGTQFRQRLNLRYQASKAFREMLHRMTLFWAIGAIACSIVTTIIVFTIQRDAAYVVRICLLLHISNLMLILCRSDGSSPSCGPVCGPPSPSPGCKSNSQRNTRSGPLPTSRHSPPRSLFFALFLSRLL
jgi:hypothetical protein